jgi:O-antigen/teichoic acid export membrane protein
MEFGYLKGLLSGYGFAGLNIVVQIIMVPMYLRYLGKTQFGVLMMLLAYINYASLGVNWLTGGLLRILGVYHAGGDIEAFSRAFRLGRYVYVGYAVLLGCFVLLVAWIDPEVLFGNPLVPHNLLWWSVFAAVIYLVLFYELSIDRVALMAAGVQHWAYLLQMLALFIYAVGAAIILKLGGNITALMAMMSAGILAAIFLVRRIWSSLDFAPLRSIAIGVEYGRLLVRQFFGRRGVGYFIYGATILTMQADVLFIGWLGGAEMATEYVVVWKAAEVAVLLLWRIPETLIPDFIRADVTGDESRVSASYWKAWRWTLVLSAVAGLCYAWVGDRVVGLWLGNDVLPSRPHAFDLAGLALFILASTRPPAVYAYALCRFRALLPVAAFELLIKLAVLLWTFPAMGYLSPLVGLIVANLAGAYILYFRMSPKRLPA